MKTHRYFEEEAAAKHPESVRYRKWCQRAIQSPIHTETQDDGMIRHYILVPEVGKYMRVVTLEDGETVFNAFFDRRFKP